MSTRFINIFIYQVHLIIYPTTTNVDDCQRI